MITLNRQSVVLALGGGGARGIAHLGVVEVLLNMGVDIQRLVGVSIGSLAGAVCAVDRDITATQKKVIDYLTSESFQSRQAVLYKAAPDGGRTRSVRHVCMVTIRSDAIWILIANCQLCSIDLRFWIETYCRTQSMRYCRTLTCPKLKFRSVSWLWICIQAAKSFSQKVDCETP